MYDAMKNRFLLFTLVLFCGQLLAQVHITVGDPSTWSKQALSGYVGKTVVFDAPMVVCGNTNENYTISPWRRFQPENQGQKGSDAYTTTSYINSHSMFNLTGASGYHRCGEKIYNLTVYVSDINTLKWQSGTWKGNTRSDLEKSIPDLGDYRLLVCGFNLENYFMTLGSMGAQNASDRQAQRTKVSKALKQINADIYGLVELQQGNEAIDEIVSDLNSANLVARKDKSGKKRNYKHFSDAVSGTMQKTDFVYDANQVEPVGTPVETNVELSYRKKMVCFREIATGEKFIYSINHFKAMNSGGEEIRVSEAKAVVNLYNTYRQDRLIREKDVLVMGDLNCYGKTRPIAVFTDAGMIDLHRAFHADSSYSYMYGGMASYIDHAIANGTMYRQVTGMSAYHINSDEDDYYTYNKSNDRTMFRCSDHDPVLVGLRLDSTLLYDPSPKINAGEIINGDTRSLIIQDAHQEGQKSYYAIYSINGWQVEQKEIKSAFHEVALPKDPGMYIICVYYNGQAYQRKLIVR